MTVLHKRTHNSIGHLIPEDIEKIGVELYAMRQSVIEPASARGASWVAGVGIRLAL